MPAHALLETRRASTQDIPLEQRLAFWEDYNASILVGLKCSSYSQAGFAAIQVQDNGQPDLAQSINHQDRLERALRQQIQRERRSLESGLAVLASIGSTSPFIGLFGTVWGIMEALKGISAAGSASLETVAGPIGSALIATGVGIAVAVPAVLVYNYFLRRLKLTAADLDDFAHDFYSLAQKSAFRVIVHPSAARQAGNPSRNVKEAS